MSDRDILKSTLSTTPECLAPEQLEALLDGKRSHPHLAQCTRCQAELALLKSFEFGAPLPDEGAAVAWISSHLERQLENIKNPSRGGLLRPATQRLEVPVSWLARIFGFGGMRWVLPAAAVAAIAIASAILLRPAKAPELQANAARQSAAVYRSQEVQLVSPIGDAEQVPRELRWQTFAGAATYRVVVMEVDHSALWNSETKQSSVELPASLRAKMLPGKPILWQVTALDTQARVVGTSQVQKFVSSGNPLSENPKSAQ
jgi:hypothetical protein